MAQMLFRLCCLQQGGQAVLLESLAGSGPCATVVKPKQRCRCSRNQEESRQVGMEESSHCEGNLEDS